MRTSHFATGLGGHLQHVPTLGQAPGDALAQMQDLAEVEQRIVTEIRSIAAAVNQLAALVSLQDQNVPFIFEKINACCEKLGLSPLEGRKVVVRDGTLLGPAAAADLEEAERSGTVEGEDPPSVE